MEDRAKGWKLWIGRHTSDQRMYDDVSVCIRGRSIERRRVGASI